MGMRASSLQMTAIKNVIGGASSEECSLLRRLLADREKTLLETQWTRTKEAFVAEMRRYAELDEYADIVDTCHIHGTPGNGYHIWFVFCNEYITHQEDPGVDNALHVRRSVNWESYSQRHPHMVLGRYSHPVASPAPLVWPPRMYRFLQCFRSIRPNKVLWEQYAKMYF